MRTTDVLWNGAPERPSLSGGEIHVWATNLESSQAQYAHLFSLLTERERQRAKRFRFSRDAQRFVIARGTLRLILSRYLASGADRIQFSYGPQGKPRLTRSHSSHLKFNLSRSDNLALYAIAREVDVGVDVERVVSMNEVDQIADRILSPPERARFSGLNGVEKLEAIYANWVVKEAILKATGEGLAKGFDPGEMSLIEQGITSNSPPGTSGIFNFSPSRAIRRPGNFPTAKLAILNARRNWQVQLFDIPGYKAAVALEAQSSTDARFYWFR